jgi:hypothetical protein
LNPIQGGTLTIDLVHEGRVYGGVRFALQVYPRGPHETIAPHLLRWIDRLAARASLAWIGGKRLSPSGGALYAPASEKLATLRRRLDAKQAAKHPDEHFVLRDEDDEHVLPRHRLEYHGPSFPHGASLELWLPSAPDVVEVLEWLVDLPFFTGHGSSALVWEGVPAPIAHAAAVRAALHRHPGLDLSMRSLGSQLRGRVRAAQWFTLLAPEHLEHLTALHPTGWKAALPTGITAHAVSDRGVAMFAGETPRLGDASRGDHVEELRALARFLWPLAMVQSYGFDTYLDDRGSEASIRWVLRHVLPPPLFGSTVEGS